MVRDTQKYIESSYQRFYKLKNRSKGPVLIGLEEIVQRQVEVGVGRGK